MALISIVVPAYNVEKYLEKCIASILAQTYQEYEVILVDDGSTDNTSDLCDHFTQTDARIKVFHKTNGGLSDARNYGIEKCCGEYITFIDSDDYVDKDYLETLYRLITQENNIQISVVAHKRIREGIESVAEKEDTYEVLDSKHAVKAMLQQKRISHVACAKLFSTECWKTIRFPVGQNYEDYATIYKLFALAEYVAVDYSAKYYYVQRSGSIMHGECTEKTLSVLDVSDKTTEFIIQKWPDLEVAAKELQIKVYIKNLQQILNTDENEFLLQQKRIIKKVKNEFWKLLFSPGVTFKTKVKLILALGGKKIFKFFYNKFEGDNVFGI